MNSSEARSYYESQSFGRSIKNREDVAALAAQEAASYNLSILPYLSAPESCRIYEAATGPGLLQFWLKERAFDQVEGSDMSATEATIARQINPRIETSDSLAHLSTFPDNSFNAIIAFDFLEHIPREDFRRFLSIAYAKLTPDGILILRGPNGDSPFVGLNLYNDPTHIWCYTTTSLSVLHRLAGFSHITFTDDTEQRMEKGRWLKLPIRRLLKWFFSKTLKVATGISLRYFGSSYYSYAYKAGSKAR